MLKDAATLSWPALVKQVLPLRDSRWLASASGVVLRTVLQTIVLPRICSSSAEQLGAALAGEQLEQLEAEGAAAWQ